MDDVVNPHHAEDAYRRAHRLVYDLQHVVIHAVIAQDFECMERLCTPADDAIDVLSAH